MIRDLDSELDNNLRGDFVIIGGGTAGLTIAQKLASLGLGKIVVLELGGNQLSTASQSFPKVEFSKKVYRGADEGRFAGLGGTSARWGGALIPFQPNDFSGQYRDLIKDVNEYIPEIESIFTLPNGDYLESESVHLPNYITRKAKWPKFSKRNVAKLFDKEIRFNRNLVIYTHANVLDFEIDKNEIRSIFVENSRGIRFTVQCQIAILSAGAIESTRILLKLEEKYKKKEGLTIDFPTGLFFSDHLSVKIAELAALDNSKLNTLFGYRFTRGGSMSNIRFELDPVTRLRESLPPHFVHISFDLSTPGGFAILREIFREIQERRFPSIVNLFILLKYFPWMARALWWRFVKHRLLYPDNAKIEMHLVFEQCPTSENRIIQCNQNACNHTLEPIEIAWGVSHLDEKNLTKILENFKNSWHSSQISQLVDTFFLDDCEILESLATGGGIYHPTGSTRIQVDGFSGSVDVNLKVNRFSNLYLVSTSVLNWGGGANPTMTELMLGLRLVDHLNSLHGVKNKASSGL